MIRIIFLFIAGTTSAVSAPFDLDESEFYLYAKESITRNDRAGDGVIISSGTDVLNLTFKSGFGVSDDEQFIRIDLPNGQFNSALPATGIAFNASFSGLLVMGGGIGDDFAIVQVTAPTPLDQNTGFTIESNSFVWLNQDLPFEVRYTLYDRPSEAVNQLRFLYQLDKKMAELVTSVGTNFTQSFQHAASINQDLLRFEPTFRTPSTFELGDATEQRASLGKVLLDRLLLDDVRFVSDSTVITDLQDVLVNVNTAASSASLFGYFAGGEAFLNAQDDCLGASLAIEDDDLDGQFAVSIDNLSTYPVLCMNATSESTALKRSAYYVDLGLGESQSLLGEVVYDAVSVDIPHFSQQADIKQSVYLVNHSTLPVKYVTVFVSDTGMSVAEFAKDAAMGVIPAEGSVTLNFEDLISTEELEDNQISGRIYIDANKKDVAAAIRYLSLSTNSTPYVEHLNVITN